MRAARRMVRALAVGAAIAFGAGADAAAQQAPAPVPVPADSATADSVSAPSPGGAFLRSLLVPGWGQAAYGAHTRGGVFFMLQAGSGFMLVKTVAKLGEARDIERRAVGLVRDSLLALAATDPDRAERYAEPRNLELDVQKAAEEDGRVKDIRGLVHAREEQREDWIAMTIFVTLMSGVDALVNAHLSDFPARVDVEPAGAGRVSIGVSVPAGGPP